MNEQWYDPQSFESNWIESEHSSQFCCAAFFQGMPSYLTRSYVVNR